MALDLVNITGTFNFPDATWTDYTRAEFVISGYDTDTEVVTPQDPVSSALSSSGALDVDLWANQDGLRGTTYNVYVVIYTDDSYTKEVKRIDFGPIQITGAADIKDLLDSPVSVPGFWYSTITEGEYLAAVGAVAILENVAGTGDAIIADIQGAGAYNYANVFILPASPGTNTVTNPTIDIDGNGPITILSSDGGTVAVGDIVSGVGATLFKVGTEIRQTQKYALTGAEIKSLYESEPDTNAFTDALLTKLNGIEANADVTDTANVTAAGALMDSEVSSLSGVKTLTVPDNTTISTFGSSLVDDASATTARVTLVLENVDNTSDINKPVSAATQAALDSKADKQNPTFTKQDTNLEGGQINLESADLDPVAGDNWVDRYDGFLRFGVGATVQAHSDLSSGVWNFQQGLTYGKSIFLGSGYDLNTLINPGVYDGYNFINSPFSIPTDWAYVEVLRHSQNDTQVFQRLTMCTTAGMQSTWIRHKVSGTWYGWTPTGGFVTPGHYGSSAGLGSPGGGGGNDAVALQAAFESGFPVLIDKFYTLDATNLAAVFSAADNGVYIQGMGSRSGIILRNNSSIGLSGFDQDNPWGWNTDIVTMKDLLIISDQTTATNPTLTLTAADGDSGSSAPGVHIDNVHLVPSNTTTTAAAVAGIRLYNIRQGTLSNVSIKGKYFQYQGEGIQYWGGSSSAATEIKNINVRIDHVQRAFHVIASVGAVANDDIQGVGWSKCTALAVDVGWYVEGGAEGFGEWFTVDNSHAYMREIGLYGTNAGNVRASNNYLLGHGALATVQGVALTGTSLVPQCDISHNLIRLDAATGANRYGINTPATLSGVAAHNRCTGATNAYGLVNASFTQTDNA